MGNMAVQDKVYDLAASCASARGPGAAGGAGGIHLK